MQSQHVSELVCACVCLPLCRPETSGEEAHSPSPLYPTFPQQQPHPLPPPTFTSFFLILLVFLGVRSWFLSPPGRRQCDRCVLPPVPQPLHFAPLPAGPAPPWAALQTESPASAGPSSSNQRCSKPPPGLNLTKPVRKRMSVCAGLLTVWMWAVVHSLCVATNTCLCVKLYINGASSSKASVILS